MFWPLHSNIQVKIGMMVELYVGNYAMHDGLFNGANGAFQCVSKWISHNPKVGSTTKIQNQHLCTTNIQKHWTPIQPISKEIEVGDNSSQVLTKNNNSMALVYFIFTTFLKNTHYNVIFKHKIFNHFILKILKYIRIYKHFILYG